MCTLCFKKKIFFLVLRNTCIFVVVATFELKPFKMPFVLYFLFSTFKIEVLAVTHKIHPLKFSGY